MRQFVLLLSTLVAAVHGSYPHFPSVPASGYSVPYTCCGPPAAPVVAPASVVASAPVVAPTAVMAAAPVVSPAAVVAEAPVVAPAPMIAPAPVLAPAAVMPAPVMASAPVYTSMVPYAMKLVTTLTLPWSTVEDTLVTISPAAWASSLVADSLTISHFRGGDTSKRPLSGNRINIKLQT
ncbi:hypothetical protein ANCDUO_07308 [Ancylostoma duodenale]|uniref:Uncharacterized protein n=1 Tax=Ancylostoma duodenale TaxID=51022 RepID=A0A0C2GMG1_9BILA|nr:hypothetical protein ANCDUO_07308 [Ancylostoma duodenale]